MTDPDFAMDSLRLQCKFQRIVDFASGEAHAWQARFNGEPGTSRYLFSNIIKLAHAADALAALELHTLKLATEVFSSCGQAWKLAADISPSSVAPHIYGAHNQRRVWEQLAVPPSRIILNLVDPRVVPDRRLLTQVAQEVKSAGFLICADESWPGLRDFQAWAEVRPDYLKIGSHFLHDIANDDGRRENLRALIHLATIYGTRIIVENIDSEKMLNDACDAGLPLGWGDSLGPAVGASDMKHVISHSGIASPRATPYPHDASRKPSSATVANLMQAIPPVSPVNTSIEAYEQFARHPHLHILPVVDNGWPVGLISRERIIDAFARPYSREIHGKRRCTLFMDMHPLIVDRNTSIQEMSNILLSTERRHFYSGFIITESGNYAGVGTGHDLMREITQLQILAARHTNPLTQLPGNVAIQDRICALLAARRDFIACYADLDHFKPFNDIYGYELGDQVILLTASTLNMHAHKTLDFVGHIGGDDFIVLFQSENWEERCKAMIDAFDRAVPDFYSADDRERGGCMADDRQGNAAFHPIIGISLGIVKVCATDNITHLHIASAAASAKKQAKKVVGSSMFIDRRSLQLPIPAGTVAACPPEETENAVHQGNPDYTADHHAYRLHV